jgi:CubicO group peptidase (beta-lactamase class C family)
MKKLFAILIATIFVQALYAQDSTRYKIDELLNAYQQLGKFNGSVLLAGNGRILLEKGYGFKNFSDKTVNDPATVFQIASVTKQFTAIMILKLVELKKLALSDRLSKFFPGFPKGDSITIENLLTHTSGITDHYNDDSTLKPSGPVSEEMIAATVKKYGLSFSPGSDWQYSNKGYQLLGFIIEKVTGMRYFEAVRKYIFLPLKMGSSGFDFSHLVSPDKATGYWSFPDNNDYATAKSADIIDSTASFSAGSIYSTVGDLYKWHQGLQNNSIIPRTLLEKAYTPQKNNYGFGLFIDSLYHKRVISHSGDIFGFKSDIERVPSDDLCVVLLSNVEEPNLVFISKKILAIMYREPYDLPAKNKIVLAAETLKQYVGSYEIRQGQVVELTLENGHLMAVTDQKQELYAQEQNDFLADDGTRQIEIRFERNPSGQITDLYFYMGGQKITCRKIK